MVKQQLSTVYMLTTFDTYFLRLRHLGLSYLDVRPLNFYLMNRSYSRAESLPFEDLFTYKRQRSKHYGLFFRFLYQDFP